MDKIEHVTDQGRLHFQFSNEPAKMGVVIEKEGVGKTTGLTLAQRTVEGPNKSSEHYQHRYKVYKERRQQGESHKNISIELGLSETTLSSKHYEKRYNREILEND